MNEIKIAVLGSEGVGKSALIVRFLTRRFIGEYASSSECIYRKCLSVDGGQIHLELYDPCSQYYMKQVILEKIRLLWLHLKLVMRFTKIHRSRFNTTNQTQGECWLTVNHRPCRQLYPPPPSSTLPDTPTPLFSFVPVHRRVEAAEGMCSSSEACSSVSNLCPHQQACEGKSALNDQIHWADGFVLVYDISDRSSFLTAKAIVHLIRELHLGSAKKDIDSLIFLVGNKQDLCHMREVQREEGQCLAAEYRCQFYELSVAEHYQEVAFIFSKMVQNASVGNKAKERRRRPSSSKSMAKLINNVFGKRRKSV